MKNKFIIGKTVLIPTGGGNISGASLLTGELYYNICDIEYKTVKSAESIESKLDKTCVVISGKAHAVGLKYTGGSDGPELLLKTTNVKLIKKLSKELGLKIIVNEELSSYIFNNADEYSIIPEKCWYDVAEVFAGLLKEKDKWFRKKTKLR